MTYTVVPQALLELDSAITYYEGHRDGLGLEFLAAIRKVIGRMLENPRQFPSISRRLRKAGLRRFPYGVIFEVQAERMRIVAIAHGKQRPKYWKDRLK